MSLQPHWLILQVVVWVLQYAFYTCSGSGMSPNDKFFLKQLQMHI